MKVLLVEDDPAIREGMAELLAELARVRAVGTVAEAVAALGAEAFDLVVTDLRFGGDRGGDRGGGREVVAAARRHLAPVVICSAFSRAEVFDELRDLPPDAVLLKPFQIEDALSQAERFLRRRRDADRYATRRSELRDGSFAPVQPGLDMATLPHPEDRNVRWFRLAPGAAVEAVSRRPTLTLVTEGTLEVEGARQVSAGQSLYATVGAPLRVRSAQGASGVVLEFER